MDVLAVTITLEQYETLIDLKSRVDVLVDLICRNGYIRMEDALRILNTAKAIDKADELKAKDEAETAKHDAKFNERMEEEKL